MNESPRPKSPVLRFLFIVGIGIVGGTLCGCLINLPFWIDLKSIGNLGGSLTAVLMIGAIFGAPFGAVAFPLCYYLFLSKVPLQLALAVTVPSSVVAGWLTFVLFNAGHPRVEGFWYFVWYYTPGFLGLVLSSIWLSIRARRRSSETTSSHLV